jgi:hypothetical protein
VPPGSTQPFSLVVFGDWGQVDSNGANQIQANLMAQIARSGARFAVTTGDNGYPAGSQLNCGDLQQTGGRTSVPSSAARSGRSRAASIPMFAAIGDHGLARGDAVHPHLASWPADVAVASSGGRCA